MNILYGEYQFLATGGSIGDCLFFFCSGYTLFLGRDAGFLNWYKRRINRIYPTVFAWMLVCCIFWHYTASFTDIILHGGGWFVECIMVYYVLLWFIKRYFISRLKLVFLVSALIIVLRYFLYGTGGDNVSIYGCTTFKYWLFFLSILSGAMLGIARRKVQYNIGKSWKNFLYLSISLFVFYALFYTNKVHGFEYLQLLSIIPLIGIANYLYKLCNSQTAIKLYNNRIIGSAIKCVGGLCLEIYLVQYNLFTDALNGIFPLNIIIIFLVIVIAAYVLHCISNLWKQTFSESDYNWRKIISPY